MFQNPFQIDRSPTASPIPASSIRNLYRKTGCRPGLRRR